MRSHSLHDEPAERTVPSGTPARLRSQPSALQVRNRRPVLTKRLREGEVEGGREAVEVVGARQVEGAQRERVSRRPLNVEKPARHPVGVQRRDKGRDGDLGRVPLSIEHRLAGEEATDRYSVQPTAQTPVTGPRLDRMSPAELV